MLLFSLEQSEIVQIRKGWDMNIMQQMLKLEAKETVLESDMAPHIDKTSLNSI